MQTQIIALIAALRTAGVPVSLAESLDALRAVEQAGIDDRSLFRATLRATLIKAQRHQPEFDRLFDLYFSGQRLSLLPLDTTQADLVEQSLAEQLRDEAGEAALQQLFAAAVSGQPLGHGGLLALLSHPAPSGVVHPRLQAWIARQALRDRQLERLDGLREALLERLRQAGMHEAELERIAERVRANQAILAEQLMASVVSELQRRAQPGRPALRQLDDLLDLPLHRLSNAEEEELRVAVARLVARLRTRISLRQRHDRRGALQLRRTLRASLRYGGTPFTLLRQRRRRQPRLVVLCDVSNSMHTVARLMLWLVAALHDQVRHLRAFAYHDSLHEISSAFRKAQPGEAIANVLGQLGANYTRTDLGSCLEAFVQHELSDVDKRTSVLILGDGRNNGCDPGLAELQQIKLRAQRLIWLTPEPHWAWGSGDSAMQLYAPICDTVHVVASLRQLSEAVAHTLMP